MNYYLFLIILFLVAGLAAITTRRVRFSLSEKLETRLLWIMVFTFFLVYAALGWYKLEAMQMGNWDFGIYDSLMRNAATGRALMWDFRGPFDHFTPIMLLFVPLYWIHDTQMWLVLIQASALAFAAPLLYATVKVRFPQGPFPLLLTAMYLFNPYYSRLVLFDFHAECLFPLFFFGAFYFLERKRMALFFLLLVLTPLVKEDFVIPVGATGLWLLMQRGRRRWGIGAIAAALFWTLFVLKIYYPYILQYNYAHYGRYELFAPTIAETLRNAYAMIERVFSISMPGVVLSLLVPFALLPLGNWKAFILLWLPVLGIQLVSDFVHQQLMMSHYCSALLAVTPIAALYGMRTLRVMFRKRKQLLRFRQPALAAAIVLMLGCHIVCCDLPLSRYEQYTLNGIHKYHGGFLSLPLRPSYWSVMLERLLHADGARALFEQLPITKESTVVCQNEPGVYFLPRARVFDFPIIGLGNPPSFRADFFILDRNNYCGLPEKFVRLNSLLDSLLSKQEYGLIDDPNGVLVIYRRSAMPQAAGRGTAVQQR